MKRVKVIGTYMLSMDTLSLNNDINGGKYWIFYQLSVDRETLESYEIRDLRYIGHPFTYGVMVDDSLIESKADWTGLLPMSHLPTDDPQFK